jgi:MFS family permease
MRQTGETAFPPGLGNAFLFATFNAFSFQSILGGPMVLYAKTLGASATVLGIIAGMMPLLVIFQIPAASHINRIGYRRFVLAGWGTLVLFIFGMALVPLTGGFLDPGTRLSLMLMLLFCFNLSRGISSCAWLPWITVLVPENVRGRYLAFDSAVVNTAGFLTFLGAAGALAGQASAWQFGVLFGFSAVMGAISLTFLKRIPDVPVQEEHGSRGPVPWLAMMQHPPFKKLLRMVVAWSVAYGGLTVFTTAFLKTEAGLSEGWVMLVTSVSFLGGLCSLWLMASRLDRLGSKPVLKSSIMAWIAVLIAWAGVSGGLISPGLATLVILQFCMGLLAASVNMASTRLAMAVIPPMGRNHFFALYSVLLNVTQGLAPVAWGMLIDLVGNRKPLWLGVCWNRFTVFFVAAALVFGVTFLLGRKLDEPRAASMEALLREILVQSPQRLWFRFWPRN